MAKWRWNQREEGSSFTLHLIVYCMKKLSRAMQVTAVHHVRPAGGCRGAVSSDGGWFQLFLPAGPDLSKEACREEGWREQGWREHWRRAELCAGNRFLDSRG